MDLIRNLLPGEITFAISLTGLIYQKGFARERLAEQLCCRPPGIPPLSLRTPSDRAIPRPVEKATS